MSFYQKLSQNLKGMLTKKELKLLPRSYQIVGKILLIKLKPRLIKHRKLIGRFILKLLPYIHSVALQKEISGLKREPKIEIIAGCKRTQTLHKEYGCKFFLDISKIMWSKGNKAERARLVKLAKADETVVDMFAGIGYWSLFLAKRAKKIYAIDINPEAIKYLEKNVWLNGFENKIEILRGDCRKFAPLLKNKADRIIIGYIYETEKFLPAALKIAKNGCIAHFHRTVATNKIEPLKQMIVKIAKKNNCKIKFLLCKKVKSYAPNILHVVLDLKITKS